MAGSLLIYRSSNGVAYYLIEASPGNYFFSREAREGAMAHPPYEFQIQEDAWGHPILVPWPDDI